MTRIGNFQNIDSSARRITLAEDGKSLVTSNLRGRIVSAFRPSSKSENQAVKKAFIKSILDNYGTEVANSAKATLDRICGRPLTGRVVQQILKEHTVLRRRADSLQTADIRMLLGKSGAIDPDGRLISQGLLGEHLTFLQEAVGRGNSELTEKLAFASDASIREMLATALGQDVNSHDVTQALAAIRRGSPNQISDDRSTIQLNGKTYGFTTALGEGGAGAAAIYTADDGESVVVKTAHDATLGGMFTNPEEIAAEKQRLDSAVKGEALAHRYAVSPDGPADPSEKGPDGNPRPADGTRYVAGFGGVIRGNDGTIHLAIQHCKLGDSRIVWGQHDGKTSIIDRLLEAGDLASGVANKVKTCLAHDLLKGMHYLHLHRNMVHLDLKPHNLFMDETGRLRLGDFGLARETMKRELEKNFETTRPYQSKELYEATGSRIPEQRFAYATDDSYSIGVMLLELILGNRPFETSRVHLSQQREEWFAAHAGLAEGEYSTGDPDWDALINGLTHRDPDQRISLDVALKSPVFQAVLSDDGSDVKEDIRALIPKLVSFGRRTDKVDTLENQAARENLILELVADKFELQASAELLG